MAIEQANVVTVNGNQSTESHTAGITFVYSSDSVDTSYHMTDRDVLIGTYTNASYYTHTLSPNAKEKDKAGDGLVTYGVPGSLFTFTVDSAGVFLIVLNVSLAAQAPTMRVLQLELNSNLEGRLAEDVSTVDQSGGYDSESLAITASVQAQDNEVITGKLLLDGADVTLSDINLTVSEL